jgi:DNA-binding beta-propeller fold protein YncE
MMRQRLLTVAVFAALLVGLSVTHSVLDDIAHAQSQGAAQAPRFEVDPFWPKPLPNQWLLGNTIGLFIDPQDTVWVVHRGAANLDDNERGLELKISDCCTAAPPVLAFDRSGTVIQSWGGPGKGYDWPSSNHGLFVDPGGNVWIGGNGPGDSHIVKFTRDGKFVAQYGKPNARMSGKNAEGQPQFTRNSRDPDNFGRVAKIFVDGKANEAYLADGYFNRRVAVIDANSGKMKRFWGAYGKPPDDSDLPAYDPAAPPRQTFGNPVHCADLSRDGLLYVCDRVNDRIQVFRPDGTFVTETFIAKNTKGSGSVWDIAFSHDPQQRFLYVADGQNNRVYIVERSTMKPLTSFGTGGRMVGQFFGVHSIAVDSQGNIYTTETYEGKRVQKFLNKGLAPVTQEHQRTVWPR